VQGSGNIVAKDFVVQGFSQVELNTIGQVYIEQGDTESLTIETDDNVLPFLEVRVENGKLILREEGNGHNFKPSETITYKVTVKNLAAVTTNSSGDITIGPIETDVFTAMVGASGDVTVDSMKAAHVSIESNGSGVVKIGNVDSETVQITARASGRVEMAGRATRLEVEVGGSGEVFVGDLQTSVTKIYHQASGAVTVWAVDTLDVTIGGSGNVAYYGNPKVTQILKGSGIIQSLGNK